MPLHHILPDTEILVNFVLFEEVDLLQLVIHVFLRHPFLSRHEMCLLAYKLCDAFTTDRHVLLLVTLVEWNDAVVVGMAEFIKVEKI